MATPPKAQRDAAAKAKAEAAAAEASGAPRTHTIKGLTLTLPEKLPFAALQFAVDDAGPREMLGMLRTILGEEQTTAVFALGLDVEEGLELIGQIVGAMGLTSGESSASPTS